MDLKAMLAALEEKTGKTAAELAATLSERTGITAESAESLLSSLRERSEAGIEDAKALADELAAKAGLGVDKVGAFFEALKADYEEKGLSGLIAEAKAKLDTDGDGSILDDLKDAAASLLRGKDPSA